MTLDDVVNGLGELAQFVALAAYILTFALGFIAGNQR